MLPIGLGQRCGICEHLSPTHIKSVPGTDRRLACEVELSSTSQANRRLSASKIIYVNIIWGIRDAMYDVPTQFLSETFHIWDISYIISNSIFPTIPDFQNGGGKCRTRGCRKSANKVWYWPWFFALQALAVPSTFFGFSSSPISSFFLHNSWQGRE